MLRGFGMSPAVSRSLVMGVALTAVLAVSVPSYAQEPAPAQPAAPAAPAAPVLPLEGDVSTITILIKPDKTADFESVLAKLKESLAKSEKPGRKEQAAGWTVYKANTPGPNGNTVYVMMIAPVVKGEEYDISRLIAEVFPVEVQEATREHGSVPWRWAELTRLDDEALPDGVENDFGGIVEIELLHEIGAMGFNCLESQGEKRRDLLVRASLR